MIKGETMKRFFFILLALCFALPVFSGTRYTSFIGEEDINWWDGGSMTFTRRSSTGGTVTLTKVGATSSSGGGGLRNLKGCWYVDTDSAIDHGDVTTEGSLAWTLAQPQATCVILPPTTVYDIETNLTVSTQVELLFSRGAILKPASGITLTFSSGYITAGIWQIFNASVGTIDASGIENDIIRPDWWGIIGNGTVEDTDSLQAAINAASGKTVMVGKPGTSYLTDKLDFISDMTMVVQAGTEFKAVDMMNTKTITAITNVGGDTYNVACVGHGGLAGDNALISGTTNFNNAYNITFVDVDNYQITQTGSPANESGSFTSRIDANDPTFRIVDLDNVKIYGHGSKITHTKANYSGAQNHCVRIQGSDKIHIEGLGAEGCGGDGFYIGTTDNQSFCSDVVLLDVYADNCKRQGLTIVSGQNIHVKDSRFTNSEDNSPEAGIDIEPNDDDERLINIVLENIYTADNEGGGIAFSLQNLGDGGTDYDYDSDGVIDAIDVHIINHFDDRSNNGIRVNSCYANMRGHVTIDNPVSYSAWVAGIQSRNWGSDCASIIINDPVIVNPNESQNATKKFGSAITIFRDPGDPTDTDNEANGPDCIGSLTVRGADIYSDLAIYLEYFWAQDQNVTDPCVEKVAFLDPVRIDGNYETINIGLYGTGQITDKHRVMWFDMSTTTPTISRDFYASRFTNDTATGLQTATLDVLVPAGWPDVTFEVTDAAGATHSLRIDPDGTSRIYPLTQSAGDFIESNVKGSTVTLRRTSSTSWHIVSMSGRWVPEDGWWNLPANSTPNIEGFELWKTANVGAVTIIRFDGNAKSQCIFLLGADGGNTTIQDNSTDIYLNGAATDRTLADGDTMHLCCEFDSIGLSDMICYEVGDN
jgi:hypothetical protein